MALAALMLLNVKMGRLCVKTCRMEIINLRFAPTGLKELAAGAITGLLVKNLPFIIFLIIINIIFSSITTQLQIRPCLKVFNSYVYEEMFCLPWAYIVFFSTQFLMCSFSENGLYKTHLLNFQISMKMHKFYLTILILEDLNTPPHWRLVWHFIKPAETKPIESMMLTIQFRFSGNHVDLYFVCTHSWFILYTLIFQILSHQRQISPPQLISQMLWTFL